MPLFRRKPKKSFLTDDSAQVGLGAVAAGVLLPVSAWLASLFAQRMADSGLDRLEEKAKKLASKPEVGQYRVWYRQNILQYLKKCAKTERQPVSVIYSGVLVKKGTPVYHWADVGAYVDSRGQRYGYNSAIISSNHTSFFKEDTVVVMGAIILKNTNTKIGQHSARECYKNLVTSYLASKLGGLEFGDVARQYYNSLERIDEVFGLYEPGFFIGTGLVLPEDYLAKYGIDRNKLHEDQRWLDYLKDTLLLNDIQMENALTFLRQEIKDILPSYLQAYDQSSERDSAPQLPYSKKMQENDSDWLKAAYLKTGEDYLRSIKYPGAEMHPVHTVFVNSRIYAYKLKTDGSESKIVCVTDKHEENGDRRIRTANNINYDVLNIFWLRNEFVRKLLRRCCNRILLHKKNMRVTRLEKQLSAPGLNTTTLSQLMLKLEKALIPLVKEDSSKVCKYSIRLAKEINKETEKMKAEYHRKHPRVM